MQNQNPDSYSQCAFTLSAPHDFVLVADAVEDVEAFLAMSRADILKHPHARFATAEESAEAWRCWLA